MVMTRFSREERRMSLTAVLWLLVLLLCVFQPVRGEKGRFYDELLWTKSRWSEYTLEFPYRAMLFSKPFQESASQQETGDGRSQYLVDYVQSLEGGSFESTMLGGGYDDVVDFLLRDGRSPEDVAAGKEKDHEVTESNPVVDIRMGVVGQNQDIGLVLDTILNDGKLVSDLVDCDVQQALNTILWPILGNWTLLSGREITDKELMDIGADVCKVEVPVAVLKDNTLMQIVIVRESSSLSDSFGGLLDGLDEDTLHQISTILTLNESLDAHVEKIADVVHVEPRALKNSLKREFSNPQGTLKKSEQEQEYYLVMLTRHSQHLLQMEVDTIKASCSQVLRNENWRNALLGAQRSYARVAARAIDFSGMGSDSDFAADDDHDRNIPPRVNRNCVNYHPLCDYWARKGECSANPKYMVGTEKTGQCRLACGVCEKTELEALPIDLSSKNAQMLEDAYMEILTSNMIQGCPHAVVSDDVNLKESLGATLKNHSSSLASVSEQIQRVIGPISIKMFTPSALSNKEEESSRGTEISMVSAHSKAVVALPSDSKSYPDLVKPPHLDPDSKDPQTLLWEVLNDRCIYSFQGYWNYQLCYGISVQQYHVEAPQGKPQWVISLGDLKSAPQWDIVQRKSALYESREIPAVVQEYTDGNECTVEDEYDEAFDAGRPSHRKSVVYFMCSPDSHLHMTTDEGTRCLYTIEVYIPDLCESDQLAVNSSLHDDGALVDPDDSRHSDDEKYEDAGVEASEVLETEYAEEEEEEEEEDDEYADEEDAGADFEEEMNHDEL
ncbi:hypothetical protein M9434_003315 [Picochlorum sp. BPE23]|nr:hypothetical protein M9434_003315 [Picochlorum sp. BPE23]